MFKEIKVCVPIHQSAEIFCQQLGMAYDEFEVMLGLDLDADVRSVFEAYEALFATIARVGQRLNNDSEDQQ